MDSVKVLLPLVLGGLGYLLVHFWFAPIIRYREGRRGIHVDLIYYANAISIPPGINPSDANDPLVCRVLERMDRNRKRSAELAAAHRELPVWYKYWLAYRGENPEAAAMELIGLSNTYREGGDGIERIGKITSALRLPRAV